ncbi:MAG: hypothetical protein MUE33_10450 [Cytophagaceae bacterium]|jgi:hypothetical protein|nr:hypothetical protein [Cytophagaceae bacterium]
MKKAMLVSIIVFVTGMVAFASGSNGKSHKAVKSTHKSINDVMRNAPNVSTTAYALVNFSVDDQGVIHVVQVMTHNDALRQYVYQTMDNKKLKLTPEQLQMGMVKVEFQPTTTYDLYFQY